MSLSDLDEAFELIERNLEQAEFQGPKSADLIEKAEVELGIEFPTSYKNFIKRYGVGDIFRVEILGLFHDDFDNSGYPDAVWMTRAERETSGLPNHLVIVNAPGDGTYMALDCSKMDDCNECPVVAWHPAMQAAEDVEVVAEDFGLFLKKTLQAAI